MNNNDLEKGIQDMQNIHLTSGEKKYILKQVMNTPVVSPYVSKSIWSIFTYQQFAYATLILLLVMSGGVLAYADEGTVPGDLLYPIKRHVTEPIHDLFVTTPEARATWEATKATRRLDEAQKLAEMNKLTPEYQKDIEEDFHKHAQAFHNSVRSLATSSQEREDLDGSFDESIKKHGDILGRIHFEKGDIEKGDGEVKKEENLKDQHIIERPTQASSSRTKRDFELEPTNRD